VKKQRLICIVAVSSLINLGIVADSQLQAAYSADDAKASFAIWKSTSQNRAAEVKKFEAFLVQQKVANILPTEQLLLSDAEFVTAKCPLDTYVLPPQKLWPNVVPTLRLIKSHIVPAIGPVKIVSGYRPPQFNNCIGGAKGSKHMSYGAFDLVALKQPDQKTLFKTLCQTWSKTPASRQFGLGAYFDPKRRKDNPNGRFHVDAFGQRTWGYDFTRSSSYCVNMK
jgi:hypothetical protein